MKKIKLSIGLIFLFMLSSCLAAGVPYTSNPRTLTIYGNTLIEQGRVWQAVNMYDLALEKYTKKNDKIGMGAIYIKQGNLYRDDINITREGVDCTRGAKRGIFYNCADYLKAIENYQKAIEILQVADATNDKYEFLRLSHTSIARLKEDDDKLTACNNYKLAFDYYNKAKKIDASYEVKMRGGGNFEEFVRERTRTC